MRNMSREKYPNTDSCGERLRKYRKSKGLNGTDFSGKIGISQGTLSDIEKNKTKPSANTIASLIRNTDIDIVWFLTGEESINVKKPSLYIFNEIEDWINETSGKGNSDWFENQFVRCFPDFLRWREKKELRIVASSEEPEKKIA